MTILHWAVSIVAIIIAAQLIPGVEVTLLASVLLAVVLGIVNVFLRPIINILTLPLNILTLGIFSLIVNALIVMGAGMIIEGLVINGFWAAFFFAILMSLINALFLMGVRKR